MGPTPNAELGVDHARLPVTHTYPGNVELGGTWYYYSRGCSDLYMDVGVTLVARNRTHAALRLEQRRAMYGVADGVVLPSDDGSADEPSAFMESLLKLPERRGRELL